MADQPRELVPGTLAARLSGLAFAWLGSVGAIAAAVSILVGRPAAAHDLAPIASFEDLVARFSELAPVIAILAVALVAAVVAGLAAVRRLPIGSASIQLATLGLATEACLVGDAARIGHSVDGGVLAATVLGMMGGAGILAGGLVTILGREWPSSPNPARPTGRPSNRHAAPSPIGSRPPIPRGPIGPRPTISAPPPTPTRPAGRPGPPMGSNPRPTAPPSPNRTPIPPRPDGPGSSGSKR